MSHVYYFTSIYSPSLSHTLHILSVSIPPPPAAPPTPLSTAAASWHPPPQRWWLRRAALLAGTTMAPMGRSVGGDGGDYVQIHRLRRRWLPRSDLSVATTMAPVAGSIGSDDDKHGLPWADPAMSPADGSSGVDGSRTWRQQWQPRRPNERWRQAEFSSAVSDCTSFDLVFDECLIL